MSSKKVYQRCRELWHLWADLPSPVERPGMRVPRELISELTWVAPVREPTIAEFVPPKKREPMSSIVQFKANEARKYPKTVSGTAMAVVNLYGCKFACGEPGNANFRFCNEPRTKGSYCAEHHAMAYYLEKPRPAKVVWRYR